MTETEAWLAQYFEANGTPVDDALLDENYFERELLDSFGIVQLILGIEDELGVRLEPAQMQDPRFCTIRGLAQIVDERRT